MIRIEARHLEIAGTILDRMQANRTRGFAITRAPEAVGRDLLAFGLAMRADLTTEQAVSLLAIGPDDRQGVPAVAAWIANILPQPAIGEAQ
ncbi:hypothetical protein [Methylobacterium haplocladii]|uniref:Uncharacterized protein n=1 Tax=Methylobacterium haplocladii TaxID=1176176 RepID=A0A512IQZ1_9HYPH|nr:hypothetical protein [Methylobacterium haplocladii]GEP00039.1 hypothetical protein MHA02_24260 [Methylobacterium haplocladii]GJD85753.1 hypothetical protein HPGCJGGD_3645 [Methylobacterium haplocladii]GLS59859.1 hypothetical protein GCM10007887_25320 [Methylobacterium haplocladii]